MTTPPLTKTFLLLLSTLLLLSSCRGWRADPETVAELEECITEEMDRQHIPALSILIFKGDEVKYSGLFGESDLGQGLALADDHLFLLASISKTITATALLQLYDQGLFALDDPIGDYLPFAVAVPGQSTPITFRMLLTHTSAIADGSALDGQYYYGEDSPIALADFMESYLVPGGEHYDASENFHDFEPGSDYEYSNEGSALIGVLVESISGEDFNTYCRERIFAPLGMEETFWRLDEIDGTIVRPYTYSRGEYEVIVHYTFTDFPNGGLRSTTRDMHRLLTAFVDDGVANGHQLLDPSTVELMRTPQIPEIDETVGLHMFLMSEDEGLWGHDGGEEGVSTIMAFHPQTKVGALIFTNQGDANLDTLLVRAWSLGERL